MKRSGDAFPGMRQGADVRAGVVAQPGRASGAEAATNRGWVGGGEAGETMGGEGGGGADGLVGRGVHRDGGVGRGARCVGRAAGQGGRGRGGDEMAAGERLNHPATISDQPLMSMVSDVNWSLV